MLACKLSCVTCSCTEIIAYGGRANTSGHAYHCTDEFWEILARKDESKKYNFLTEGETRLSAADQMSVLEPWTLGWSVLGVELPKAKVVLLSRLLRSSRIRSSRSCKGYRLM